MRERLAGISACLIVKDEQAHLPRCLASLRPHVSEIRVLDTGSTDDSVAIARGFGAEVSSFAWCDDFAAARNASIAGARHEWLLVVDADEELAPGAEEPLRLAVADASRLAWLVARDDLRVDGSADRILLPRLLRNVEGIAYARPVHEDPMDSLFALGVRSLDDSGVHLRHYGYLPEVLAVRDKVARNLRLLREHTRVAPSDVYSAYKLGATLLGADRQGERLAAFEQAFALAEARTDAERAELPFLPLLGDGLAASLLWHGRLESAIVVADRALEWAPDEPQLLYRRGDLAARVGDVPRATRLLWASIRSERGSLLVGDDRAARSVLPAASLARLALARGDVGTAERALEIGLGADRHDLDLRAIEVQTHFTAGRLLAATNCLSALVAEAPRAASVHLFAGDLAWAKKDAEGARALWSAACAPGDAGQLARARVGLAALALGDEAGARDALAEGVARDVDTAALRILIAAATNAPCSIDPAFSADRLLACMGARVTELLARGGEPPVLAFAAGAPRFAALVPGIERLVVPG